ncbi:MAG: hypothetical protein E3J70_00910 [Candidatus Heimdallarchaeota archaeon]|nr:MAG: hypothetical protein E3J70_00910 [Candidatus Heimdallarchaeota archaeon]
MSLTDNSNFHNFSYSDAILFSAPKGDLYPIGLLSDKDHPSKKLATDIKFKILSELRNSLDENGNNILADMPLPERFSKDEVFEKWSLRTNNYFNKIEEEIKAEKDSSFSLLIETLEYKEKIEHKVQTKNFQNIDQLIKLYEKKLVEAFKLIYKLMLTIRTDLSIMFLDSELPSEFITTISNTMNSSLTFLEFLQSEQDPIIIDLKKYKSGRTTVKKTKPILSQIDELDEDHSKLLLNFQRLLFFIEIWNSPSLDELFTDQDIHYDIKNFESHQEFFIKSLNKLDLFAKEFHHKVIDAAKKSKQLIPFSLKEKESRNDDDAISLYAKIIHSF